MWANFHTHSHFCDGKLAPADYVASALKFNLSSLGFSSHAPLPFERKWCMKKESYAEYLQVIHDLKHKSSALQIYTSLEIDYVPQRISPAQFVMDLDYTIGSVHFVDADSQGNYLEIDGPHEEFLTGLKSVYNDKIKDAVTRYYELTREMLDKACPTILGHFDKIKIQNIDNKFFDESDPWYKWEIDTTLAAIKKSGVIVEVNTRGIYRKKCAATYPGHWILSRMQTKEIPITISSDAHHPDELIGEFTNVAAELRSIGFHELMILIDGVWKPKQFDADGIKY